MGRDPAGEDAGVRLKRILIFGSLLGLLFLLGYYFQSYVVEILVTAALFLLARIVIWLLD